MDTVKVMKGNREYDVPQEQLEWYQSQGWQKSVPKPETNEKPVAATKRNTSMPGQNG